MEKLIKLINDVNFDLKYYREKIGNICDSLSSYSTPDELLELSRDWSVECAIVEKLEWFESQLDMLKNSEKIGDD